MSSKRAKLIGRSWDILEKLYDRKYFVHELAEALDRSDAGVSPYLSALKEEGLIDFEEGEGRRRYYRLKGGCREIVEAIMGAQEPQMTSINEEEFDRLLDRIHSPGTQDLALEGLSDMSTRYTLKSDMLIKKVFELIKSDVEIPHKMYRIFSKLCYKVRKESLLDDELITEIAGYTLDRIKDASVTKEEKTEVRDLWIILDTVVGSNEIVDYCINYAREKMEPEYKDGEQFIRETLKNALRSEEKREEVRQRLWKLVEADEEDVIKNRYKTFLRYDVGLYNGALQ